MYPDNLPNWMMVFVRLSAMLTIFPIFSAPNLPVRLRVALAGLGAFLISPALPPLDPARLTFESLTWLYIVEAACGVLLGFTARMLFYALDFAASLISAELGLTLPMGMNPLTAGQSEATNSVLYYLAAMIFLSLDIHHWCLAAFQRAYVVLPVGGARFGEALLADMVHRSSQVFVIAVQIAAPMVAVSFLVTLILAILSRAVPQMNVFSESFAIRILTGMTAFGFTFTVMSAHIRSYLQRLPEDFLRVAQLAGLG